MQINFYDELYIKNAETFDRLLSAISIAIIGFLFHNDKYKNYKFFLGMIFISLILSLSSILLTQLSIARKLEKNPLSECVRNFFAFVWYLSGIIFISSFIVLGYDMIFKV